MAMSKKMSAPNNVNNTEDSEEENDTAQAKVASLKLIQSTHNIEDFPLKVPSNGCTPGSDQEKSDRMNESSYVRTQVQGTMMIGTSLRRDYGSCSPEGEPH